MTHNGCVERSQAYHASGCPVSSHNEWNPLEEVIVGRLDGAAFPPAHITVTGRMSPVRRRLYPFVAGRRYPRLLVEPAEQELEEFVALLRSEGVKVRRPEAADFTRTFRTESWCSTGFCNANPRDCLLVVGNEIIEAPMSARARHHEAETYRVLLSEYVRRGARYTVAPKPKLMDSLYERDYSPPRHGDAMRYVINESEPVFDAADFVRCGADLFVTRSNATNLAGIDWLRRHLGPAFRIHEIKTRCCTPLHIDTTLIPLAEGRIMINPEYVDPDRLPEILRHWDILVPPDPDPVSSLRVRLSSICSRWLALNVLSLDEKRVIVESHQPGLIRALRNWGFEPIPCAFQSYAAFGGSFHCATLDIRRCKP
jgi:glycine amidinotransferase